MSALDLLGKGLLTVGVVIVIILLILVLFAISAAIGGLFGYLIGYVYVNWLGLTIAFSLTDCALIGSIVGVVGSGGAAAISN